jgi:hypothetical protein
MHHHRAFTISQLAISFVAVRGPLLRLKRRRRIVCSLWPLRIALPGGCGQ